MGWNGLPRNTGRGVNNSNKNECVYHAPPERRACRLRMSRLHRPGRLQSWFPRASWSSIPRHTRNTPARFRAILCPRCQRNRGCTARKSAQSACALSQNTQRAHLAVPVCSKAPVLASAAAPAPALASEEPDRAQQASAASPCRIPTWLAETAVPTGISVIEPSRGA